ncbi:MAG: nucleoside recognition domain-containing protein [Coxiellaceae bacterium]|nr:nucleoside recognition domain-containing protein [Coxiellaceae bacterium]
MLNVIWLAMMLIAVVTAFFTGKIDAVVLSVTDSAKFALTLAFGLTGVMALWLGIMRIAEESGLIEKLTQLLRPLLVKIFPDIPKDDPAIGIIAMNLSAIMLGLTNAATPFGLRAMEALEKLNPQSGTATNTMCTFIALHSANLQLIPTTAIALLAAAGASHPTDIVVPLILSSLCAVFSALLFAKVFEKKKSCMPAPEVSGELS